MAEKMNADLREKYGNRVSDCMHEMHPNLLEKTGNCQSHWTKCIQT
jgi:hypothetical protein